MLLIKFGHGRWDVAYDRDYATDDRVEWTNVSTEPVKVNLHVLDACPNIRFTMQPGESYVGYVGSVLSEVE